jgi:hypothetical protein
MNHFLVNGVAKPTPLGSDENFGQLLEHLRAQLTHENSLISAIKVNGMEISELDEKNLRDVPLSALDSIEVLLVHPRELAEETLQTLRLFTERLAVISRELATNPKTSSLNPNLQKLLDGIQTLIDAISTVKSILKIGALAPLNVAEQDLLSILKDIVEAQESGNHEYRLALLSEHLPRNLEDWSKNAIPAIIRSRDS